MSERTDAMQAETYFLVLPLLGAYLPLLNPLGFSQFMDTVRMVRQLTVVLCVQKHKQVIRKLEKYDISIQALRETFSLQM